jgi:hypothetical protein
LRTAVAAGPRFLHVHPDKLVRFLEHVGLCNGLGLGLQGEQLLLDLTGAAFAAPLLSQLSQSP